MDVGILWFDKDADKDVPARVGKAAEYYYKKYGKKPNVCYVNPKMIEDEELELERIIVKSSFSIQPNYFWIGVRRRVRKKISGS